MKITFSSSVRSRKKASALMLMVWAIMLMAVTVAGVVRYVGFSADEATIATADFRTLHLAECGITLGLHPTIRSTDPILKQKVGTDSGFEVWLTSEGARIPINYITDERLREAIYRLFENWGLSTDDATIASESLADWVDSDNDQRSQGAETTHYEAQGFYDEPRQRGFISVEEMLLVRGMDKVEMIRPDWRDHFSVYSDGVLDLRHAMKEVIMAMTNAAANNVDRFISERDGKDSIHGTEDDGRLNTSSAIQLLGLSGDQYRAIQANVEYGGDSVRRVESIGWVGDKRRKITVIARRQDDNALTYLARIEE